MHISSGRQHFSKCANEKRDGALPSAATVTTARSEHSQSTDVFYVGLICVEGVAIARLGGRQQSRRH